MTHVISVLAIMFEKKYCPYIHRGFAGALSFDGLNFLQIAFPRPHK